MAKPLTGSVTFNKSRKRWLARISPVDPETGEQKDIRRFTETKAEALKVLRELITAYSANPQAHKSAQMTFAQLAAEYRSRELIEAQYVGEQKIAGIRKVATLKTADIASGANITRLPC